MAIGLGAGFTIQSIRLRILNQQIRPWRPGPEAHDCTHCMELYFIRHGETAWSLTGQHTGKTDLPLTLHGETEARTLGPRLHHMSFDQVFTSPRIRARQTCELAGYPSAIIEPDLAEWDYGTYEGLRSDEIHAERPAWDIYSDGCPAANHRRRSRHAPTG